MSLHVHRMHTRVRTHDAVAPQRLAGWQDAFGQQDGERIAARWVRGGEWLLIRRLPLHLRWRGEPADADVGRAWGEALERAIARALEHGDGNCVRYRNRQAALADLFYRAALGDDSRHWAWQRMELIPRATLRSDEVLRHAAAALAQEPDAIWPVLVQLLQGEEATASLTAVLRALPLAAWSRLFEACPRTAGFARWATLTTVHGMAPGAMPADWNAEAQALLHWASSRAWFAKRHHDVLLVLLCAIQRAAVGMGEARLQQETATARRALAAVSPSLPEPRPAAPAQDDASSAIASTAVPPMATTPASKEQAPRHPPELPQAKQESIATRFGGALFWLTRVAADGLRARCEQADEPLPVLLRELALALGVPADDPVVDAFCGGPRPREEASGTVLALAQRTAADWEAWLAEAAPELAAPRLQAVCRRPGRLEFEPGWIALHLPLDGVDTSVRRLGLDLDPGWLPWLGCVVRIVYEEA